MELSEQEMELFLPLPGLWSKTSFTKCLSFVPSGSKLIFKTGNRIIQTGNGIISPTSRPLIKKLLLQKVFHSLECKIDFRNRKWNYPNRKWRYLSHFKASIQKAPFTKCISFDPRGSKLIFETGNGIIQTGYGIIQTGNGIISPTCRSPIKKFLFVIYSEEHQEPILDFENGVIVKIYKS